MDITFNDTTYTFSVRKHPGKFSQEKQAIVGKNTDIDCHVGSRLLASVTIGLKPSAKGDVPETAADAVKRLVAMLPDPHNGQPWANKIKEIATLV